MLLYTDRIEKYAVYFCLHSWITQFCKQLFSTNFLTNTTIFVLMKLFQYTAFVELVMVLCDKTESDPMSNFKNVTWLPKLI